MRKIIMLFFASACLGELAKGQSPLSKMDYPQIITPSPEAAALGKYGDVGVSLFSGIPHIQIPIYNYRNGDLNVNIGLSYNAGGIRVDEIATNVGLGWVLNAGGVVTTSVLGIPDEVNNDGFPGLGFDPNNVDPNTAFEYQQPTWQYLHAADAIENNKDMERDIHFFNFLGQSGKFVIDRDSVVRLIPANPNIKIAQYNGLYVYGFVITDDRGVKYYFTETEYVSNVDYECSVGTPSGREHDGGAPTWYLTKIQATDDREILFEYESYNYTVIKGYTETEYFRYGIVPGCDDISSQNRKCLRKETFGGKRLKKIYTSNNSTKVQFGYSSTAREDLTYSGSNAGNSLDTIKVYDGATPVKEWLFTYGYFGTATSKRLKLLTAKEDSKPAYEFTYDETYSIPEPGSLSQDHWGYYNGAINTSLIPPIPLVGKTSGGNRNPDIAYMKTGTLTKLLYPTGGTSVFEFEGHTNKVTEDSIYYVGGSVSLNIPANGPDDSLYFKLPSGATDVFVTWELVPVNFDDDVTGIIMDSATRVVKKFYRNSVGSEMITLQLTPGVTYILNTGRTMSTDSAYIGVGWSDPDTLNVTHTRIVYGGLRIKSIKDYDSVTGQFTQCKYYNYNYDGTADSSTIALPVSPTLIYNNVYQVMNSQTPPTPSNLCTYAALSSSSVPIIGNGTDNGVGYRQVMVRDSAAGQSLGRTIYKYSVSATDVSAPVMTGNTDWCKGFLLEQIDQKYDVTGNNYKNVRRIRNIYQAVYNDTCHMDSNYCEPTQSIIPNMKLSYQYRERTVPDGQGGTLTYPGLFLLETYFTVSAVVHLMQTDETLVDTVNGNSITTSALNYYENDVQHIYPTKRETTDSRGNLIRNNLKYAFDMTGSGAVYSKMIEKNIVAPVLEETATNVTHSQQIAKKQTTYQFWNGVDSLLKPYQILTSQQGAWLETHLTFSGYDDLGNLLGFVGRDSLRKTYLWDYDYQYPIAEALKADSSQIAFTSFETSNWGGSGKWVYNSLYISSSYAMTGSKSYPLSSGSITRSGLTSATYVVSYWGRSGSVSVNSSGPTRTGKTIGDWTYYEHEVTGTSLTVSGSNYIDELRLYPKGALMTSYTYIPLVGLWSQSDVNGHITYYEYDSYNRLKLVRDEDGKILKRIDYKYKEGSSGW